MEQNCLACGEDFVGRSDKKFCSDYCRNVYNNNRNRDVNNYMRNVNNILRKNRRILAELNPNGKAKVTKNKLIQKGFNFEFHTNIYTTKKEKKVYYFCYEQGYLAINEDYYTLVIRKEYV